MERISLERLFISIIGGISSIYDLVLVNIVKILNAGVAHSEYNY
jgi:hypothetical protein